jgi:hypothetical protein
VEKKEPEYIHYCPCCGEKFTCPCGSCDINKTSKFRHVKGTDGDMACVCGFVTHLDHWQDIEIMQLEEQGFAWGRPSTKED